MNERKGLVFLKVTEMSFYSHTLTNLGLKMTENYQAVSCCITSQFMQSNTVLFAASLPPKTFFSTPSFRISSVFPLKRHMFCTIGSNQCKKLFPFSSIGPCRWLPHFPMPFPRFIFVHCLYVVERRDLSLLLSLLIAICPLFLLIDERFHHFGEP